MSGSGGGGYYSEPNNFGSGPKTSRGGGNASGSDACTFVERTLINSPNPDVLPSLKAQSILQVSTETQGGRTIPVAKWNGITVGSFTIRQLKTLIDCMQQGCIYVAVVIDRTGGRCSVEIRRGTP